jgi:hypothetical protein
MSQKEKRFILVLEKTTSLKAFICANCKSMLGITDGKSIQLSEAASADKVITLSVSMLPES